MILNILSGFICATGTTRTTMSVDVLASCDIKGKALFFNKPLFPLYTVHEGGMLRFLALLFFCLYYTLYIYCTCDKIDNSNEGR